MLRESRTEPQVFSKPSWDGSLDNSGMGCLTYDELRAVRSNPTVVLARTIISAPMLAAQWSVVVTPDEERKRNNIDESVVKRIEDYATRYVLPLKSHMQSAVLGCIDYGFQPFEKIIDLDETDNVFYVKKLKPLLQDYTTVLVDEHGRFTGLKNKAFQQEVELSLANCLLYYIDVEGTNWYGQSMLANAVFPFRKWKAAADDLTAYNGKVAGSRFIVNYPDKMVRYNGQDVHASVMAKDICLRILRNEAVAMPNTAQDPSIYQNNELTANQAWSITTVENNMNGSPNILAELQYWDNLLCRVLGAPERAALEAQYGSKADSEQHTASLSTLLQNRLDGIMDLFNQHLVNQMVRYNFGEQYEDIVRVVPSPITDEAIQFIRQLYMNYLMTDEGIIRELPKIDFDAVSEKLGVPRTPVTDTEIYRLPMQNGGNRHVQLV